MADEVKVRSKRISGDRIIRMLTDSEGVAYSKDNNPKRKGSNARARFTLYEHGMTVAEAREAGVWSGDIHADIGKGFISLQGEEAVEEKAA